MKKWWLRYSEKIDASTLRERALIFFSAAFILVALLNSLFISPMLARQRQISNEIAQMQSETRLFQEQLQAVVRIRGADPDAPNRNKLAQLKRQLAENEKLVQDKQSRLVPPGKIAVLLEDILTRNRKLELVGLKKLPAAAMTDADSVAGAKAPMRQIFRHGVEVTVRGAYLDQLSYITELEKLPLQMYWTKIELVVDTYPMVTMKLTVYTLSLDQNWLVV